MGVGARVRAKCLDRAGKVSAGDRVGLGVRHYASAPECTFAAARGAARWQARHRGACWKKDAVRTRGRRLGHGRAAEGGATHCGKAACLGGRSVALKRITWEMMAALARPGGSGRGARARVCVWVGGGFKTPSQKPKARRAHLPRTVQECTTHTVDQGWVPCWAGPAPARLPCALRRGVLRPAHHAARGTERPACVPASGRRPGRRCQRPCLRGREAAVAGGSTLRANHSRARMQGHGRPRPCCHSQRAKACTLARACNGGRAVHLLASLVVLAALLHGRTTARRRRATERLALQGDRAPHGCHARDVAGPHCRCTPSSWGASHTHHASSGRCKAAAPASCLRVHAWQAGLPCGLAL